MKTSINNLVRKNIQSLAPYSSAREEYSGKEGIFLDANENPFGIYNRYPDPYQLTLKKKLAEIKNTSAAQIFIGNGSDEIIDLAFRIFCEPGQDKALTFVPTYGMYEVSATINDVELIKLPLDEDFQIQTELLMPYFSDSNLKLIFICSPNNPTGNLLRTGDIEFVLENFSGIVIIDEAYIDFSGQFSLIEKLNEFPNLIILQTLSKAWGLAGIRLGIGFMSEEILSYFNRVKPPYNVSLLNQQTALEILNNEEVFEKKIKTILAEKEKMIRRLSTLNFVRKIYPSDANFFLVEVDDADELYQKLIEKKIIIRNRNSVIKNCLRISVGTPEEIEELFKALKEFNND